jgi:hypothetical protein
MSWTAYYTHSNETDVFYVELTPTGASPVRVAGTRNTNKLRQWSFGPLTDGAAYDLILQAGASPASTDTVYGAINNDAATAATQATAAATEIGKVPRAAVAMNGGDDFALNAVTDTTTKLTVNYTNEA